MSHIRAWREELFRAPKLRLTVLEAQTGASRGELAAKLARHGVAFFPNAFSKEECELLIQQFVDNCEMNEVRGMKLTGNTVLLHSGNSSPDFASPRTIATTRASGG